MIISVKIRFFETSDLDIGTDKKIVTSDILTAPGINAHFVRVSCLINNAYINKKPNGNAYINVNA